MRFIVFIIAVFFVLNITIKANGEEIAYSAGNLFQISDVERMFREKVKPYSGMTFTYVPRGLIISIDENVFFNPGQEKLRCEGLPVLDEIAGVLRQFNKSCVIEGHTENVIPEISSFKNNWELSLARANNITMYLMRCANISPERLFPIGYGEFVPFRGDSKTNMNSRIDFVIIDYEVSR